MKISFKRITSSGNFIPEIDGLRFIAILSVVTYHLCLFINAKDFHVYYDHVDYSWLKYIVLHGKLGVPLFFIISGFILGLPFANYYIKKSAPINIKSYFLRRLTRLEPPYILVMFLLFIGSVYVVKNLAFIVALKSLFASLTYTHNFFYPGVLPLLNASAWSLEIEVQFYILAPILALIFLIQNVLLRRAFLIFLIGSLIIFNQYFHFPFFSLINFLHYFLLGFLLVDIFICKKLLVPKTNFDYIISLFLFIIIWLFKSEEFDRIYLRILWEFIQITAIFMFYYYVLVHKTFNFLRNSRITNIGGMCYSIYLVHYAIISMFGNVLSKYQFFNYSFLNIGLYIVILSLIIILITSVFFLVIEKPCMNKNWITNLIKKK